MNFYLVPAVSYQTQQKLKDQLGKRKHRSSKHSQKSDQSKDSNQSIFSSSVKSSNDSHSMENASFCSAKSGRSSSLYEIEEDNISDIISEYIGDSQSRHSTSRRNSHLSIPHSVQSVPSKKSATNHVFNYAGNEEIVAFLDHNKMKTRHRRNLSSSTTQSLSPKKSSSSSADSISPKKSSMKKEAVYGYDSEMNNIRIKMKNVSVVEPQEQEAIPVEEEYVHNLVHFSEDSEDSEDEEEMGAQLTRVFSDVDSIFSKQEPRHKSTSSATSPSEFSTSSEDLKQPGPRLSRFRRKFI